MDDLKRLTHPVTCDHRNHLPGGVRYSAVSFDDGFISVFENALPELESKEIPATVFIPTGCLGQPPGWMQTDLGNTDQEHIISAEEIKRLKNHRLLSFGSHSVSHPNFLMLGDAEARHELSRSRQDLEALLERQITLFSFPHGTHEPRLVELAQRAGYDRLFTIDPEPAFIGTNELIIGRIQVDPSDWPIEFRLKLLGAYRWLAKLRKARNTNDRN
jgi:peptidoglycan/xylan/chitin deacetylase (PgdA/CDA1 family)